MRKIKHFNENMKVRICHSDKSRLKHEVIKTICVMLIKNKYKSKAKKIYTEYPIGKEHFRLRGQCPCPTEWFVPLLIRWEL